MQRRLKWAGHVVRMNEERWPRWNCSGVQPGGDVEWMDREETRLDWVRGGI